MSGRKQARRIVGLLVHNWPLKVGALVLASLLYVGLVAMQDSSTFPGPVPVLAVNVPADTMVTNQLRPLDEIRYVAPADLGRLTADDFLATVDLSSLPASGTPVGVHVSVAAVDPRITVIDVRPRTIQVVLDRKVSAVVPVVVVRGTAPPGVEVGDTAYAPQQVTVIGPSMAVSRVASVQVNVEFDPGGLDYDQEAQGVAVDASGAPVTGVELSPRTVHVTIPLYKNKQSRTLPVSPVLAGDPAPGFRVAGVTVAPLTVTLAGDADQLARLPAADTAPVPIYGATRSVTQVVAYSLPLGITPIGAGTVSVTVQIQPLTETRTFTSGLRLDGGDPALEYQPSVQSVLLTLFGSMADLDRLGSAPVTVGLDVSGLGPGAHSLAVVPVLPAGISVVSIDPAVLTVTVIARPSPAPN